MDHYIEISLLPDPEFSAPVLMNALFAKLHRALVENGKGELGVSFPNAGKTLGSRLRIHGNHTALTQLMSVPWLKGLRDYTGASSLQQVPENCQFRVVRRLQVKSSPERLRRRSVAKGWLKDTEAIEHIPDAKQKRLQKPFVQLKSHSSGQSFRLFIHQGEIKKEPSSGSFSSYGLSNQATIPWF